MAKKQTAEKGRNVPAVAEERGMMLVRLEIPTQASVGGYLRANNSRAIYTHFDEEGASSADGFHVQPARLATGQNRDFPHRHPRFPWSKSFSPSRRIRREVPGWGNSVAPPA
jgi:hypothetical protein